MKKLKYLSTILALGIFLSACASNVTTELDEKYVFADLEQVKHISSTRINGWGDIDKQSLFVSVSPSKSYLIILKRPNNDLRFAHGISFDTRSSSIYAKFDKINIINIQDNVQPLPAYIERIYKVESREQKKMIRAQIKGENTDAEEVVLKENVIAE